MPPKDLSFRAPWKWRIGLWPSGAGEALPAAQGVGWHKIDSSRGEVGGPEGAYRGKVPQTQRWGKCDTCNCPSRNNVNRWSGRLKRPSEAGARLCSKEDCCPVLVLCCLQHGHRLATRGKTHNRSGALLSTPPRNSPLHRPGVLPHYCHLEGA